MQVKLRKQRLEGKKRIRELRTPHRGVCAVGLHAKQAAQRTVRLPIHGGMGWVKTEGFNAQYGEALGRTNNSS